MERKIAIIGETRLTKMLLDKIHHNVSVLFGLPDFRKKKKVNSVDLSEFCEKRGIAYINNDNWQDLNTQCRNKNVNEIFVVGDSRIVPKEITDSYFVLGNHGAKLPDVKGGASLVWGKMMGEGDWGVSLFQVTEKIDNGDIYGVKDISYSEDMSMEDFCKLCDVKTIELYMEYISGKLKPVENKKWDVRVGRHLDEFFVKKIYDLCREYNCTIYLPGRNNKDSFTKDGWPEEFSKKFKGAMDFPYPKWKYKTNI